MYTFKSVDKSEITLYINGYYDTLLAPINDMYEESIIAGSEYYRIDEEETIGFFAINDENILTQFYIVNLKYEDVFSKIIMCYQITKAFVSSCDPIFRAVSNKFKQASTINSLLSSKLNERKGEEFDNLSSGKIIEKFGSECYHKVYNVWF
jgi:hypothetical protein